MIYLYYCYRHFDGLENITVYARYCRLGYRSTSFHHATFTVCTFGLDNPTMIVTILSQSTAEILERRVREHFINNIIPRFFLLPFILILYIIDITVVYVGISINIIII